MDEDFLICLYSEVSKRHAILADDGLTGILYLHAPTEDRERIGKVEATCFAYNRMDPIDAQDAQSYRPNPPPIAKGYASDDAVCHNPSSRNWSLVFSADGTAVLLMMDGEPWAITSVHARRGFSKAIRTAGPWGNPWSDEIYKQTEWGRQPRGCV
jgi:hypothetical protein